VLIKAVQLASCGVTLGHTQTSRGLQTDQKPDLKKHVPSCTNLYIFVCVVAEQHQRSSKVFAENR